MGMSFSASSGTTRTRNNNSGERERSITSSSIFALVSFCSLEVFLYSILFSSFLCKRFNGKRANADVEEESREKTSYYNSHKFSDAFPSVLESLFSANEDVI